MATLRRQNSSTLQEVDEAQARLASATARAGVARARVDQAAAALEAARAAGDVATTTHAFATVTAPFDGVVTETMVDSGDMAVPGVPLLRLERVDGFEAHVRVDEARALTVRVGDRVSVTLESAPAPVDAPVVEISRAVDVDPRTFLVKLALPGQSALRAGTFVRARFQGAARSAVTVPSTALIRQGQVATVFVVEDGVARLRLVRPGAVDDGRVEIVAGLSTGERVVAAPPAGLRDGRPVSALQEGQP
jgi:RND family efflux transporter MFP subunit